MPDIKQPNHAPTYGLVNRRGVLAGGLLLAFAASSRRKAHAAGEEPSLKNIQKRTGQSGKGGYDGFAPGGFIHITRDHGVVLIIPNVEMGQGIYTGEAMLIAEELEVGLDQIGIKAAPPDAKLYTQPLLKSQSTGGSTSIRGAWVPLRQAGAVARTMLIAAAAQQWQVPAEDCFAQRATVVHRGSGRTLPYTDLAEAASQQPVPQSVALKDPKDFQLIGKPLPRLDVPGKVNGSALFGIDIKVPGMKYASVAACPVLGGKLASVDDSATRKVPGVRDVLRLPDAVAVTGDHFWAAHKGLKALRINWDPGPNASLSSDDLVQTLRNAYGKSKPVVARQDGDVDNALSRAAKRVDAAYELPFLAHATMEPINTLVHVRPDGCDVWVGTQVPVLAQQLAAKASGLSQDKVMIHNQLLGGGFGRRLEAGSVGQAVAFGKQVNYPLKVIWTREEDIQHDLYRPAYYDRVSAGLDSSGRLTAWVDHVSGGSVTGHYVPKGLPAGKLDPDAVEGAAKPPYDLPAIHVDWTRVDPPIPITWWRGVGPTHNVFVVESFMDEVAHAAGKDPIAFRLGLLGKNPRSAAVLKRAAELADWGKPLPKGTGRGVSLHDSFGSHVAVVVETTVAPTGEIRLRKVVGVIDCGLVVNPDSVRAQIEGGLVFGLTAALYNDITFKDGRVQQSNFNNYRMMRIDETPPFTVEVMHSTESPGGVGETGTVSAAPALGNAIFAATGIRLRRYPFNRTDLQSKGIDHEAIASIAPAGGAVALALLRPAPGASE